MNRKRPPKRIRKLALKRAIAEIRAKYGAKAITKGDGK
ncbi:Uncharacterised protein [Neisseria meningitidis]|nr:Uncharacterised protein [Neisseria meningitidis]CWS30336.1 Uncharacterised protein [Neisseria meningitidis]